MRRLTVGASGRPYDIFIENGLLQNLAPLFAPFAKKQKVIITDSNVAPLYAKTVSEQLNAPVVTVEAGEGSKSLATLEAVYEKLIALGLTRSGMLVALGGGVVGDLTGFCASTIFRGVDYAAVPTTLLAQVDSSVGGKTAVNLPSGKNLAGTFYQPQLVAIDPGVLKTLNQREFACGMAEVIKYGAICDAALFESLFGTFDLEEVIQTCCRIKADIVARDEFDTGERMLLNFGHTIGHAVENFMGYGTLSHGAAVARGHVCHNALFRKRGHHPGRNGAKACGFM